MVHREEGTVTDAVVVGVDDSRSARHAAGWAAAIADARGAPLHLVHVGAEAAPRWLTELAAELGAHVDLAPGPASPDAVVDALVGRVGTADLLVLGSHGEGSAAGLLAGTVAARLAGGTPCPLAVVRGSTPDQQPPSGGPVVVGIDDTETAGTALDLAAALASDLAAPLVVVHAWSDVATGPGGAAHRRTEDWPELAAQGDAVAARARRRLGAHAPDVEVDVRSVEGTALRTLLDLAVSARVLVAAPRGAARPPSSDDGMLLGSTSRGLVGFAPCPVVLAPVRQDGQEHVTDDGP
ncbi:universal stress protein [Pseudonocardia sp. D17]|jgi:nucleotide-binding universal stress UspA family protein|nr:universal stress protein [Pseudonocardia sp. D17]